MEDFANNQKHAEHQPEEQSFSEFGFEEELKRQNINTMLEIYKEEYLKKIGMLTR